MSKPILFYTSEFQTKILNHMDEMFNTRTLKTFSEQISSHFLDYKNYRDYLSIHPEPSNDWLQTLKNIYNGIRKEFPTHSLPAIFIEPSFLTETYYKWLAYNIGGEYDPSLLLPQNISSNSD